MKRVFLALADKTRLRLLNLMREGEICVGSLVEVLNESQPKIYRHLAYMRNAGIVETRREGKWIHYKISQPADHFAAQVWRDTFVWLNSQEKMQHEYQKLMETSRLSKNTETASFAFAPDTFVQTNANRKQSSELDTFLL